MVGLLYLTSNPILDLSSIFCTFSCIRSRQTIMRWVKKSMSILECLSFVSVCLSVCLLCGASTNECRDFNKILYVAYVGLGTIFFSFIDNSIRGGGCHKKITRFSHSDLTILIKVYLRIQTRRIDHCISKNSGPYVNG